MRRKKHKNTTKRDLKTRLCFNSRGKRGGQNPLELQSSMGFVCPDSITFYKVLDSTTVTRKRAAHLKETMAILPNIIFHISPAVKTGQRSITQTKTCRYVPSTRDARRTKMTSPVTLKPRDRTRHTFPQTRVRL